MPQLPNPRPVAALTIRQARIADAPVISKFNRAMAMETEGKRLNKIRTEAGARSLIRNPTYGFYLVATLKGRLIGQLCVTYEWSDWHNGVYWWIQSVFVEPKHRGTGVFKALFREVLRRMKSNDSVVSLRLYADAENKKAHGVYEKLGMHRSHYQLFELVPDERTPRL